MHRANILFRFFVVYSFELNVWSSAKQWTYYIDMFNPFFSLSLLSLNKWIHAIRFWWQPDAFFKDPNRYWYTQSNILAARSMHSIMRKRISSRDQTPHCLQSACIVAFVMKIRITQFLLLPLLFRTKARKKFPGYRYINKKKTTVKSIYRMTNEQVTLEHFVVSIK